MKKISVNKILLFLSAIVNVAGLVLAFCVSWQAMLIYVSTWLLGNFFLVFAVCRKYKEYKKEVDERFEGKTSEELQTEINDLLNQLSTELKKYGIDFTASAEVEEDGVSGEVTIIDKPIEECPGEIIPDVDETTLQKAPVFKKKTRRSPKKKKQQ